MQAAQQFYANLVVADELPLGIDVPAVQIVCSGGLINRIDEYFDPAGIAPLMDLLG